jgi:hypothetical protein
VTLSGDPTTRNQTLKIGEIFAVRDALKRENGSVGISGRENSTIINEDCPKLFDKSREKVG